MAFPKLEGALYCLALDMGTSRFLRRSRHPHGPCAMCSRIYLRCAQEKGVSRTRYTELVACLH